MCIIKINFKVAKYIGIFQNLWLYKSISKNIPKDVRSKVVQIKIELFLTNHRNYKFNECITPLLLINHAID